LLILSYFLLTEDEREFSYESGSENGPEHWGELHEEWAACGKGKMQSPIDLANERVQVVHHLGHLRRTYRPASAVMMNRGHDIMVTYLESDGLIQSGSPSLDLFNNAYACSSNGKGMLEVLC